MGQLIVVSNRSPFRKEAQPRAPAGLNLPSMALKQRSGSWFGWSGRLTTHGTSATRSVANKEITYITIDFSREDHQEYSAALLTAYYSRFFTTVSI